MTTSQACNPRVSSHFKLWEGRILIKRILKRIGTI
jgi:hypothetical protein